MEYIELLEEDLKAVKFAQNLTNNHFLEDDYGILSEDLLELFKQTVSHYEELLQDNKQLQEQITDLKNKTIEEYEYGE